MRELFKARYGLNDFAGNYPNSQKYQKTDGMSICGTEKEKESHIKEGNCEAYRSIRQKYDDLEDDNNLLEYFKEVLERREKLQEEDEEARAGRKTEACLAGGVPNPPMLLVPATAGTSRHGNRNVQLVDHH